MGMIETLGRKEKMLFDDMDDVCGFVLCAVFVREPRCMVAYVRVGTAWIKFRGVGRPEPVTTEEVLQPPRKTLESCFYIRESERKFSSSPSRILADDR